MLHHNLAPSLGARRLRDRPGQAVEDVGLRHEHLVEAPMSHHRHDNDHPADDHVDAARFETGIVPAPGDRFGREGAEISSAAAAGEAELIDALALAPSTPSSMAAMVHTVPAVPINVFA